MCFLWLPLEAIALQSAIARRGVVHRVLFVAEQLLTHAVRERRIYAVEVGADCQTITASVSHTVCVCVSVVAASSYCSYATACTADGDRSELPLSKQPLKHLICAKAAEPIRCGFVMIVDGAHE